jgi:hypothetical protein
LNHTVQNRSILHTERLSLAIALIGEFARIASGIYLSCETARLDALVGVNEIHGHHP